MQTQYDIYELPVGGAFTMPIIIDFSDCIPYEDLKVIPYFDPLDEQQTIVA